MRKQIFSIAAAAVFAIPTLANADVEIEPIDEGKVILTYDLKEISSNSGREELERQIRRAADQVCGSRNVREAGNLQQVRHNRACYKDAVTSALKSIDGKVGRVAAVSSN